MRMIRTALYLYFVRWLPGSSMPGGKIWRAVRTGVAGPLLNKCGRGVNIEHGAFFASGKRVSLGDRSGLGVNCSINGPVVIGRDVMMGPNVTIYALNHAFGDVDRPMIDQGYAESEPVTIGDDVWIGQGVTILSGVTVGSHVVIAAGTVLTRDVQDWKVVAGNPARVVRDRREVPPAR